MQIYSFVKVCFICWLWAQHAYTDMFQWHVPNRGRLNQSRMLLLAYCNLVLLSLLQPCMLEGPLKKDAGTSSEISTIS